MTHGLSFPSDFSTSPGFFHILYELCGLDFISFSIFLAFISHNAQGLPRSLTRSSIDGLNPAFHLVQLIVLNRLGKHRSVAEIRAA